MKELRNFIDTNQLNIRKTGKGVTKVQLLQSIVKSLTNIDSNLKRNSKQVNNNHSDNDETINPLFESFVFLIVGMCVCVYLCVCFFLN